MPGEPTAHPSRSKCSRSSSSPRVRRRVPDEHDSLAASLSSFSDPMWQVKDRSVAGLRIAASGGIGQALALGALVASGNPISPTGCSVSCAGSTRSRPRTSRPACRSSPSASCRWCCTRGAMPSEDSGFVVNGIDVSTIGARFDGLYLPPPSRPDKPLAVKTLIVPTAEYTEGRSSMLHDGPIGLHRRDAPPRRAARRMVWAAIQIVEKRPR